MSEEQSPITSTTIDAESLAYFEGKRDHRFINHLLRNLSALVRFWGEPCFEQVTLPSAIDKVTTACRVRVHREYGGDSEGLVLVREDYRDLWEGIRSLRSKAFVLWGQAGSGKSVALHVFALICIENCVPFVRYRIGSGRAKLVIKTSVGPRLYEVAIGDLPDLHFLEEAFFLVDSWSDIQPESGVIEFAQKRKIKTVLASGPSPTAYRGFSKHLQAQYATIKLFSREEALALCMLRDLPPSPADSTTFTRFSSLAFTLSSGFPEGGYTREVIASDSVPLTFTNSAGRTNYSPMIHFHLLGPDMHVFFRQNEPRKGRDVADDLFEHYDFPSLFAYPATVADVVRGYIESWPGLSCVFFLAPKPVTTVQARWTYWRSFTPTVPNSFIRSRVISAVAQLWDEKRQTEIIETLERAGMEKLSKDITARVISRRGQQ
ncbi:hypothetical protein JCM11251_005842 [Rhodosporidiobolus azoricus]